METIHSISGSIVGRPIPWSAASPAKKFGRKGYSKPRYAAWRDHLEAHFLEKFYNLRDDIKLPHNGPVILEVTFVFKGDPEKIFQKTPDLVNLIKALEDAAEGYLYANDSQIHTYIKPMRIYSLHSAIMREGINYTFHLCR